VADTSVLTAHAFTPANLVERADAALYLAKHSGRDRACVASPESEAATTAA
jgi:PleD family two-component response regulator